MDIKNLSDVVIFSREAESLKQFLEILVKECANLSETDLKWADLKGANLEGANLKLANLEGAELEGVIGIKAV